MFILIQSWGTSCYLSNIVIFRYATTKTMEIASINSWSRIHRGRNQNCLQSKGMKMLLNILCARIVCICWGTCDGSCSFFILSSAGEHGAMQTQYAIRETFCSKQTQCSTWMRNADLYGKNRNNKMALCWTDEGDCSCVCCCMPIDNGALQPVFVILRTIILTDKVLIAL